MELSCLPGEWWISALCTLYPPLLCTGGSFPLHVLPFFVAIHLSSDLWASITSHYISINLIFRIKIMEENWVQAWKCGRSTACASHPRAVIPLPKEPPESCCLIHLTRALLISYRANFLIRRLRDTKSNLLQQPKYITSLQLPLSTGPVIWSKKEIRFVRQDLFSMKAALTDVNYISRL